MNRRNFLKSIGKICAVLPFVGSSSAVAKAGASEGQRRPAPTNAELLDVLAEGLRKKYDRQAQAECERLYKIECLRIEAAEKADNPPVVINPNGGGGNYKKYYVRYDFETKVQTVIEDGEIVSTRKFKEEPFVMFNHDPTISYAIFEKYKQVLNDNIHLS